MFMGFSLKAIHFWVPPMTMETSVYTLNLQRAQQQNLMPDQMPDGLLEYVSDRMSDETDNMFDVSDLMSDRLSVGGENSKSIVGSYQ